MITLETVEIVVKCHEEGCDNSPWRILRVYHPDVVGHDDFTLCRKHFLAHRDIWRIEAKKLGQEVRES